MSGYCKGELEAKTAALALEIIQNGKSWSGISLALQHPEHPLHPKRARIQAHIFALLRWWPRLEYFLGILCLKQLAKKHAILRVLLGLGLVRCMLSVQPDYAVVNGCVAATKSLQRVWAKGFVNACLRRFLRDKEQLLLDIKDHPVALYAHPDWMIRGIEQAWPEQAQHIMQHNNQQAALSLRVNRLSMDRATFLDQLREAVIEAEPIDFTTTGVKLQQAMDVYKIPGFTEGKVSVQDGAGQLLSQVLECLEKAKFLPARPMGGLNTPSIINANGSDLCLNIDASSRVLDACAAPGSKSCLMLERYPELQQLTCLDCDAERLKYLEQNLARLNLQRNSIRIIAEDACAVASWWDQHMFDLILCDAPCSGLGVIRRHPDIKILRREQDIVAMVQQQMDILIKLWSCLKPGGYMVYSTCSILPQENHRLIQDFCNQQPQAESVLLDVGWGRRRGAGIYILPGDAGMDGFFYAVLRKKL